MKKLSECVDLMNEQKVDFLIELGDFKDQGNPPEKMRLSGFSILSRRSSAVSMVVVFMF